MAIALLYDVESGSIKELPPYAFGRRWWVTVEWPKLPMLIRNHPQPFKLSGRRIEYCELHAQDDVSVYLESGREHLRHDAVMKALEFLVMR